MRPACAVLPVVLAVAGWAILRRFSALALPPVVARLTADELLRPTEPRIVRSARLNASLRAARIDSLRALRAGFADELLRVGDQEWRSFSGRMESNMLPVTVLQYVDTLLDGRYRAERLSEQGGRDFFLRHPQLYTDVGRAHAELVPEGFRRSLLPEEHDLQRLADSLARGNLDVSDLTLWAGDRGYTYTLHQDIVLGTLLTHMQGRKRVWLFSEEVAGLLWLSRPEGDRNWETESAIPEWVFSSRWLFRAFLAWQGVRPRLVDLEPGDSLFIPCGWAHLVEYPEPAASISAIISPDWLAGLLAKSPDWAPRDCADWRGPGAPS